MKHVITTTLSPYIHKFLISEASRKKTTKKSVIEQALKEYQKRQLQKQITEGLKARNKEYQEMQEDFHLAQLKSIKLD